LSSTPTPLERQRDTHDAAAARSMVGLTQFAAREHLEDLPDDCRLRNGLSYSSRSRQGVVKLVNYTAVDDVGTVINPMIVEGQLHGGIVQGIGQALCENCVYDSASGQPLSGSFMDYCMPRADDLPRMTVSTHNTPSAHTPMGVKGCGEVGTIGSPAAVTNAVVDALSQYGVSHIDMPTTPNRIWSLISTDAPARGGLLRSSIEAG
jgi:hypothetical protein